MYDQWTEAMVAYAASKIGCGYIYGATGWVCSEARRKQQAELYPQYYNNIMVVGRKWDGKQCFDCAQLTKAAVAAGGGKLVEGATSQWNNMAAWRHRDVIATLPDGPCIVFRQANGAMQHTGVYVGEGFVIEARGTAEGVIKSKVSGYGWTHWAVPVLGGSLIAPPAPSPALYRAKVVNVRTGLNLRTTALNADNTILLMPLGAVVDVLQDNCGNGFSRVRYGTAEGYCTRSYLMQVEG